MSGDRRIALEMVEVGGPWGIFQRDRTEFAAEIGGSMQGEKEQFGWRGQG